MSILPLQHFSKASNRFPQMANPTLFHFYFLSQKLLLGLLEASPGAVSSQEPLDMGGANSRGRGNGIILLRHE